jgi:NADPH2:quinone reductase
MRAAVVETPGPPSALRLVERVVPVPGPGELAIDVAYAGVGFVDTLFRAGAFGLGLPFTPGIEVTGRVREVGTGVDGFAPGQPVGALLNDFGRGPRVGGYAEVAVAHATMATPLPDDADLARTAAVLSNGVTAWIALHDLARVDVLDDLLVLGASGGLGGITGRLAAIHPVRRVVGVVGSPAKRHLDGPWTEVVLASELEKAVDSVDVVIDPVGGELRANALGRLAPFGRLLVLGNASGDDPPLSGDAVWLGTRQVIGLSVGGVAHLVPRQVGTALRAVVDLVHRGVLREAAPAIVPLEHAAEVHQALEDRTAPAKTVLAVTP